MLLAEETSYAHQKNSGENKRLNPSKKSKVTCQVAQLWDQHGWARRSRSGSTDPLWMGDQQRLVHVGDVQVILLRKQDVNKSHL